MMISSLSFVQSKRQVLKPSPSFNVRTVPTESCWPRGRAGLEAGAAQSAAQRGRALDHRFLRHAVPRTQLPGQNHYKELAGDLRSRERRCGAKRLPCWRCCCTTTPRRRREIDDGTDYPQREPQIFFRFGIEYELASGW